MTQLVASQSHASKIQRQSLAVVACMFLAAPAVSQSNEDGPTAVTETFRDWVVQCVNVDTETGPARICQMSQELSRSADGARVLNMTLQRDPDGNPVTRLLTPLGVALAQGVGISIEESEVARFGFQTCLPAGCIAQAQLDSSVLVALQQGIDAQVNMLGVNGEEVSLPISLLGFTGAWNRLAEM